MTRSGSALSLAALALLLLPGCRAATPPTAGATAAVPAAHATPAPADTTPPPVTFTDVTAAAGIHFRHENGAFGKKYLPETVGSGVAFLDFDGDGHLDLFFVNSRGFAGHEKKPLATSALYRNRGDGSFEDVSVKAGLAVTLYGLGATAGDYDGDGDPDLFVTALGPDHLFRNQGNGTFADVSRAAGIDDDDFGSSATWLDHDNDGDLDLAVGNYVHWTPATDLHCTLDGKNKSYCTPESYEGASPRLWRNEGNGKFSDQTRAAGLWKPTAKTLGIVAADLDQDGAVDLFVANDTQPNYLFHNRGDGTFSEVGVTSGVAFSEAGVARGAMGIDAGDYSGSGRPSLVIGNFANEMISLYHNEGRSLFVDAAPVSGVGRASLLTLAFGCFFFDFDRDGRLDIYVANGHVEDDIEAIQPQVTYAEPPHLFHNRGDGHFVDVAAAMGGGFGTPRVARGAAYGDYDGDGDLDVVVTTKGGPAQLFRNDLGVKRHWVAVLPRGTRSNRDGFGAVVKLTAGGKTQTAWVKAATSYLSQSERAVSFGLGDATGVERIEIAWPSGQKDTFTEVPIDRTLVAVEGGTLAPR
jgi:hypothetical protein